MPGLSDPIPPAANLINAAPSGTTLLKPKQQIHFYGDAEWEEFIREWVTVLPESYVLVKRIGGAGDMGADVAGFKSELGFEGPWDCYQCKHYGRSIKWSDLLPELIKVFRHAAADEFVLPDRYRILAPQGVTGPLDRILSSPTEMRRKFLDDAPGRLGHLAESERQRLLDLAGSDDFSRFDATPIDDVLEGHRASPYHLLRFGLPLPPRDVHGEPPAEVAAAEARYIEQLADVYEERWPDITRSDISTDERSRINFQRQRVRFFEAESLRAYARDAVPPGTFERFQDAIHSGVVHAADQDHESGWPRMNSVLNAAGALNLQAYALVAVAEQDDIKGVCHQLANVDRLRWRT